MSERWAVAYGPNGSEPGRFIWVRDQYGDIIIFSSQWEARKWVLTSAWLDCSEDDVVFIKIPCANTAPGAQEIIDNFNEGSENNFHRITLCKS